MAVEITIPRLGWQMEEGTFVQWVKQPGERVAAGEPLFVVESDKVTMDVESLDAGILFVGAEAPAAGAVVKPGQVIGYLLGEGEELAGGAVAAVVEPDAAPVTPRARRVARELGVDVRTVSGTGKGGRVREADVRAAVAALPAAVAVAAGVRRTIAARMLESREQTVPVTLVRRVDMSRFMALRNRWKLRLQPEPAPAIHDMVMKLVAAALREHPVMLREGAEGMDLGLAVDSDYGLMAPVVRDVDRIGLLEVAARSRGLIEAVRRREVKAEEMAGAVFSISNLGGLGVEAFTPVIHHPERGILGLGAVRWEAVVLASGQIVAREQMTVSLTFDHRWVDGAPAARFLAAVAALLEEPPAEVHCG